MILLLIVLTLVSYLCAKVYFTAKRLPPGPMPLPLIGNLHQMAWGAIRHGKIMEVMKEWKQKYGDVFTIWFGPMAGVNIAEYQVAHDAMVKKGGVFASRPNVFFMDMNRKGKGIAVANDQHWTEQRRFSLHTLRNFGLGRNLMEDRIMLEFDYRTENLNKQIEKAGGTLNFNPFNFIELMVGNIINRMLFSDRFTEEKEKRFFELKAKSDQIINNLGVTYFLLTEWNVQFPPFKQQYEILRKPVEDIMDFVGEQINERKRDIASGKHVISETGDDFVDAFLLEMQKSDKGVSFDEESLKITVFDLWLAGQETTATSLRWSLCYLVQYPEVVKKLQHELDLVTGKNRRLALSDKPNTPYLNATITEIFRVSALGNFNIWREASEDVTVGSYLIPKGTSVTAQLSLLLCDEKRFDYPEKFKPERHLGTGSDQFVATFGLGKRACLGESLARAEMYLILGNLVQSYNILADSSHPAQMEAQTEMGSVRSPKPYNVKISKRQ